MSFDTLALARMIGQECGKHYQILSDFRESIHICDNITKILSENLDRVVESEYILKTLQEINQLIYKAESLDEFHRMAEEYLNSQTPKDLYRLIQSTQKMGDHYFRSQKKILDFLKHGSDA